MEAGNNLGRQVAVHSEQIHSLHDELERARRRLHELESDRSTLRLIAQQVRELSEQMPSLARRAASEAVEEYLRRRHSDTLANLRIYIAIFSAGIALGGLILTVALR